MKIKNKIFTLFGVFTLVGLTHSLTLKDLNAALTAPISYDINYQYDALYEETFVLGSTSIGTYSPLYTRTAESTYYNYSTIIDNTDSSILPLGLEITMTFNRSNTNWFSYTGGYTPADTKIGTTVNTNTEKKMYLKFDNQTSKNYLFFIDGSSNPTTANETWFGVNSNKEGRLNVDYIINNIFSRSFIPAYSYFEIYYEYTTGTRYFDAWYLQDLGFSDAYDAGYEQGDIDGYSDGLGNNPNILLNGFQAMVGILVNFMLMILNLEVFNVSIMSVFGILALFVGVIWILKIVRG
jgi:hypothetical protein